MPLFLVSGLLSLCGCGAQEASDATPRAEAATPIRAVWVARFHYRTPADIATIMRNCREIGANTVLWQVRGEATVAYPSQFEPWSVEYGHRDPGFDPLAIAVTEAHRAGLRINAWCNVAPGWHGTKPAPAGHVRTTHPDWFLHDSAGRSQPLSEFYVILNPCLPEVRAHIVGVFAEIMTRYALDGLHLDYVRFAWDETKDAHEKYPRDAWTVEQFKNDTGLEPDDDRTRWHHWRAAQLTRLVSETRAMLDRLRPGAQLSAAVWASPLNGYREYMQNAIAWANVGLLDAIYPMAYADQSANFQKYIEMYRGAAPRARIVPGIGLYKHASGSTTAEQLEICGKWGADVALYSYESLFGWSSEKPSPKEAAKLKRERAGRLDAVRAAWLQN